VPEKLKLAVVDASVVLKWQFDDEECISQATALRNDYYERGVIALIAPQLLVYEVANGIATAARRKRLAPDKAVEALSNLLALGVELREVALVGVLETVIKYNLAAYDAAYLALAEAADCVLWTGDKPFYHAVKGKISRVKWIGSYAGNES
jgi:predicted nucleic acid-binding protein